MAQHRRGPEPVPTDRLPGGDPEEITVLREALRRADFTVDGLLDHLGAVPYAALARGETVPAVRATGDGSPLATVIRLFLLHRAVGTEEAAAALPLPALLASGWLRADEADEADEANGADATDENAGADARSVRAAVAIRPYAGPAGQDWWIVSDLGRAIGGGSGADGDEPDVVLGVGGASTTLSQLTVTGPVARALDLGTGSGIQALHLAERAAHVTATDLNPRALRMARLTVALSAAPEPELVEGSLFEPVADAEPYDLIVSNPPFVISPREGHGPWLSYRDAGMEGDELCRALVRGAAERLAPGGWCQLLANWQHREDEDWRERVSAWVPPGCDAWIIQRDEQDVARYTELWLRDAGLHLGDPVEYDARYEEWLDEFSARRTRAVGFGWITLRRTDSAEPVVQVEEWPHSVEQPLGPEIRRHFERLDFLRRHDDAALLEQRYQVPDGVVQEQIGQPGAEDPEHVVLRQRHGMMRAATVDTVGAGLVGSCDGSLSAGRIIDAIAQLLGEDPAGLRAAAPGTVRSLVEQGFLEPVG